MDLGFYDLRRKEIHSQQIALAKDAGIFGFCYYYYWFDGERLLDKPLDLVFDNPDLDFPFCICWANENWSRRWDGRDSEVLVAQSYKAGYENSVIQDMLKYIQDPRYIQVDGKPLVVVYRPSDLPSAKQLAEIWRKACRDAGIGEICLTMTHSFDRLNPKEVGFDAAIEFAPNNMTLGQSTDVQTFHNRDFKGVVYEYKSLIELTKSYQTPKYTKFRGICPSWDNEARKPGRGTILHGSTPLFTPMACEKFANIRIKRCLILTSLFSSMHGMNGQKGPI